LKDADFWTVFEETPSVLVLSRLATGEYLAVNRCFERVLGHSRDESLGKTSAQLEVFQHPQERDRLVAMVVDKGRVENEEVVLRRKSGDKVIALLSSTLIRFRGEVCLLTSLSEITRLKRAEEKLRTYQQRLRRMAAELTLAEQRERRRIATDMHDTLGQMLALSRMKLTGAKSAPPDAMPGQIDEVLKILDDANRYARTLVTQLSPPVLYMFGLLAAAEWLTDQFREQYGLNIHFQAEEFETTLKEEVSVLLFQSLRELLTNVIKHAKTDEAKVSVRLEADRLFVSVQDSGVGFEAENLSDGHPDGFGLFNIRERLQHLGGTLEVRSTPGAGTTAIITCPVAPGQ
jgi:two-component system, NarL family, sensor histidine kinase UhpB